MTGKELIEMLKIIKEQAIKSNNDTAIIDVKIDSFNFVIGETIKALEQEPFINKPCISVGICEHDKSIVLDRIRAEIIELRGKQNVGVLECLDIIDKYKGDAEP